ncbi:hypothetical protein BJH93_09145 [Kocuria polaris]|nr:hypothetical protein [Kocuria polaris]
MKRFGVATPATVRGERARLAKQEQAMQDLKKRLKRTRGEVARLKKEVARHSGVKPSFKVLHSLDARLALAGVGAGIKSPRFGIQEKLYARTMAEAHGVGVPELLAHWERIDQVRLGDLPDRFVLKAAGGAASRGVFPLERVADNAYRIITRPEIRSEADILETMARYSRQGKVRAPFFAEALLSGPAPDSLPDDIKFYTFYGEIGHVLLRQVTTHAAGTTVASSKYVDDVGNDLGDINPERGSEPGIELPARFEELVEAARTLSRASRLPFVRVDLYSTAEGIFFGEYTPRPGGSQVYTPDHDEFLGGLWEDAILRLERDLVDGMPFRHDMGIEQP